MSSRHRFILCAFVKRGIGTTPTSSTINLGVLPLICTNFFVKSSFAKWAEQMPEYFVGFHFALFTFTNLIHCRRLLFASGRSSSMNGIKCKAIPCSAFGTLEQPPTTHLAGIISTIVAYRTSQTQHRISTT